MAPREIDRGAFERLQASIDPEWIEEALAWSGTASLRKRRLPAEQVIWLVLGMALFRDRSIHELTEKLDIARPGSGGRSVARSASSQARERLGDEALAWLFQRSALKWAGESARRHSWRGLALFGLDGTSIRVPDSTANREYFGGQGAGTSHGQSGYPLVRLVTLMALRSHLLHSARFGPHQQSELALAKLLWSQIPDDSLLVADRNFLAACVLIPITREGNNRHWLTRAKKNTRWRVIRQLGKGDELVEMDVSSEARAKDPSLPKTWVARAIRYCRPGFRPQTLLTSLLDPSLHPAEEIVALYHERWEIELGYGEVKRYMLESMEAIRSKSPMKVSQELWGIAIAYNLVRLEMEHAAGLAKVPPTRISFIAAYRLIRDEWLWAEVTSPGAIPKHLRRLRENIAEMILPPRRRQRSYPRAVKIKMSNYPRKRPRRRSRRLTDRHCV